MIIGWFTIAFALVHFAVNSAFAFAVDWDATRLTIDGRKTVLVGRHVWAFAVLIGGPLVALAYWIIHRSTLASVQSSDQLPDDRLDSH
jgi:hypothetical protein